MISKRSLPLWLAYWATWTLFGLMEFAGIYSTQHLPLWNAVVGTLSLVFPGSILGLGVRGLGRRTRTDRGRGRFALQQLAFASLYSSLWLGTLYAAMSMGMGWRHAWAVVRTFLVWQLGTGVVVYGIIASVSYAVRAFVRLREEEQRADRAEALRSRAELEALRGKLQPHFLFNTLHTVTALVRSDPVAAEEALLKLGDLLRYVLQTKRVDQPDDVPLAQEMEFVNQYLALEKIRLGDRLRLETDVSDEALECVVPMFTLQPLVENAIHHAIAPRASGGTVRITGLVQAGRLCLTVSDDGPGGDLAAIKKSPGFGLRTVCQRWETRFGRKSEISVQTEPGGGFRVSLSAEVAEAEAP